MESPLLDRQACTSCGLCPTLCPTGHLIPDPDGGPGTGEGPCLACGHCAAACPAGALSISDLPLEPGPVPGPLPAEDLLAFLKARRSVRVFSPRPVPRDLLARALDAARWAPSAKNGQPVSWAVLEDPAAVRDLSLRIQEAFRAQPGQTRNFPAARAGGPGRDPVFRGAPHLVAAHTAASALWGQGDGVIALEYLELAARALGLGTCWSGAVLVSPQARAAVQAALGLPGDRVLQGVLMVGYPGTTFGRIPGRKPLEASWIGAAGSSRPGLA